MEATARLGMVPSSFVLLSTPPLRDLRRLVLAVSVPVIALDECMKLLARRGLSSSRPLPSISASLAHHAGYTPVAVEEEKRV